MLPFSLEAISLPVPFTLHSQLCRGIHLERHFQKSRNWIIEEKLSSEGRNCNAIRVVSE
jgi:hypothetical protein